MSATPATPTRAVPPAAEPAPAWHKPLLAFAGLMIVLAAVAAVGILVDDRTVAGAPAWAKPLKFAVSFALYALALAWLLRQSRRAPRTGWWAGSFIAVASLGELVLITMQAVRGVPSHFNAATPFDDAVFGLMGALVAVIWLATLVLAILVSIQRLADRATMVAIRAGLVVSLLGMLVGSLMTQPTDAQLASGISGAHGVGVPDGGPGLPLLGWATTGGDLRVPHFVGLHALQFLPVLALLLAVLARRMPAGRLATDRTRVRLMWTISAGYAGLVGLLTWQALRGEPLAHPGGTTLAAAAILAAVVGAGATWSLTRR